MKYPIRIVTATSLFDGHDVSINIIRRMLQDAGAEVIHLGHNRSVMDVVRAVVQEHAQGVCVSSYQGGHMQYFKYMKDLLISYGRPEVKIYGGGGGVIIHSEQKELEDYGIDRIFHSDDGRRLGLDGMVSEIMRGCDYHPLSCYQPNAFKSEDSSMRWARELGVVLSALDLKENIPKAADAYLKNTSVQAPILGITGTGGSGKSSLIDELMHRFHLVFPSRKIGIVCVDPSKRKTGGALLGDRIRMNALSHSGFFMRSLASRESGKEISSTLPIVLEDVKRRGFDLIIAETSGIGQSGSAITEISDFSLYVMTSEFGAQSQLEKIDMIDYADFISINKADRRGSKDALRDVKKQYRRSHKTSEPPVFLTQASHFNDDGVNQLFFGICKKLSDKYPSHWKTNEDQRLRSSTEQRIIPPERENYLSEIVNVVRKYKQETRELAVKVDQLEAFEKVKGQLKTSNEEVDQWTSLLKEKIPQETLKSLDDWEQLEKQYKGDALTYRVREKDIQQSLATESLSGLRISKISFPKLKSWADRLRFLRLENLPGKFPFTAGVFPLRRQGEDPRRQFAGEGTPEKTNKRFHYLSKNDEAKRLSTAFDSVTLYGEDPDRRPDIYGKIGESGVNVCVLEDVKKLYEDFDLCDFKTSVSMTINGPAPIILAFYLNVAIDQQVEKKEKELERPLKPNEFQECRKLALKHVRGTVQADILKEDQAQNTCIFSTDFALKLMGDVQSYFIQEDIRNFYAVSISGYHIAEAGANPISQLAFTLSNGFTYVEYYLSRGMKVEDFAPHLSFFFSNGLDPEYTVIGRVARRIWAIAMRDLYGGDERSQKLKYHIQTSGRSLHAQEIAFNDIRTTLQALIAIHDNCNSLHTNAYDEAITTPTKESVRRAMAIQMIINKEFGLGKNENVYQGSYFIEELTDLVEEAVLDEFMKLNERGGVLGAMETQYQRGRIQEDSMYYEHLKHNGKIPIIGVNSYVDPETLKEGYVPPTIEMARATSEEKEFQIHHLNECMAKNKKSVEKEIQNLKSVALKGGNVFSALMSAARVCSLGQMSQALYEVGGQYRRSL